MPMYLYTNEYGEVSEFRFSFDDRPESFTDDDGVAWEYSFGETVATQRVSNPSLDVVVDNLAASVHPNQVRDYNRTASAIGISQSDLRWDERGNMHANRTGMKKYIKAREKAIERGRSSDPEFKTPPGVARPKKRKANNA